MNQAKQMSGVKQILRPDRVVRAINEKLEQSGHFAGHTDCIRLRFQQGRLVLRGRVPSFYLKEALHKLLAGVSGVQRVDNQVDVVSCAGLSSTRQQSRRPL